MSHIENHGAYVRAIGNYIKQNAAITRRREWFAQNADAQRLWDWLHGVGEFSTEYDDSGAIIQSSPLVKGMFSGEFGNVLLDMRNALGEWGGLTPKQTELVRRALARAEERVAKAAERRAERVAADRNSQHVGAVGARVELTLRCEKVFSFDGFYGTTHINLCRDEANNVIVYKGSNSFEEGTTFRVKATIKAHEERDGVAQTLISRPKVI